MARRRLRRRQILVGQPAVERINPHERRDASAIAHQPFGHGGAAIRLLFGRNRILQVEDQRIGLARRRLGETLRPNSSERSLMRRCL
jgi:hypothetical protein